MPFLLLLLFIGVPIAEIALFIGIGGEIGLGWTLACILATALLGTALVRQQGLQTLARARSAMAENRMPIGEVVAGICILVAGALLLTPGFLTDALGFILLIPPLRTLLVKGAVRQMQARGQFTSAPDRETWGARHGGSGGPVIDGEFEEVSSHSANPDETSPWHRTPNQTTEADARPSSDLSILESPKDNKP